MSEISRPSPFVNNVSEVIESYYSSIDKIELDTSAVAEMIDRIENPDNPVPFIFGIASRIDHPTLALVEMFKTDSEILPESWKNDPEIQRRIFVLLGGTEIAILRSKLLGQALVRKPFRQRKQVYSQIGALNIFIHQLAQEKN